MEDNDKGSVAHSMKISTAKGRPATFSTAELEKLRKAIRGLRYYHPLWALLKDELTLLGYWKVKPRGDPKKGYKASHGVELKMLR